MSLLCLCVAFTAFFLALMNKDVDIARNCLLIAILFAVLAK